MPCSADAARQLGAVLEHHPADARSSLKVAYETLHVSPKPLFVQMDEAAMLEHHLEDARGSLKLAYETLNKQHATPMHSARNARSGSGSISEYGSQMKGKLAETGKFDSGSSGVSPGEIVSDARLRPSRLLTKV